MPWRTLLGLSASAAVTLTVFELTVRGNAEMSYTANLGMYFRILAATAAAIGLLCFAGGLAGSLLHRAAGLSRQRAATAGVLAAAIPAALHLVGIDLPWGYGQYWPWFVVASPLVFAFVARLLRAEPSRVDGLVSDLWPAAAPVACWTRFAQLLHQGDTFFRHSPLAVVAAWAFGVVAIAFLIRSWPKLGHAFSIGLVAAVIAAALVLPADIDLNRPDTLVASADSGLPPVILLTVDTLRRDALSLYGSETPTPSIDSLAADGIVFDRAYSTAPWTQVSFTSIHSGLTPWAHGVRRVSDRVPARASALAPALRNHGYNTAAIGKNDLLTPPGSSLALSQVFNDQFFFPRVISPHARAQAFLSSWGPDVLQTNATTAQLGRYGSEWVRNHGAAPFFLWLHFYDPHDPYDPVAAFPPAFEPVPELRRLTGRALDHAANGGSRLPGFREWNRALYQSEVQAVDQAIGEFLATLKEQGVYERALIVFASDHGEEFAEHNEYGHGQSLYNELVRVPLVIKLPSTSAPLRLSQPVSTVALAPTILDLAAVPYDGKSFSAVSLRRSWQESTDREPAQPVFMTGTNRSEAAEAVVWENYKLIRFTDIGRDELYDFASDPDDRYNLAQQLPEKVEIGKALLADHAAKEAKLAAARGFEAIAQEPLTPDEERILRSLGYLQ